MAAGLKKEILRRWITRGYKVVRAQRIKSASVHLSLCGDSRMYRDDPWSHDIEMSLTNLYSYLHWYGTHNFEGAAFNFLREIGFLPRDVPFPTRTPANPDLFSVQVECPICDGSVDYYPYQESRPGKVKCYQCGVYYVTGDFWMYYGATRRHPQNQVKFVEWVRITRDHPGRLFMGRNREEVPDTSRFIVKLTLDDIDAGRLSDPAEKNDESED